MRRAKAGVFHNHRERDLRVIGRGKGNIQGMVALVLLHACGVVLLLGADAYRLRRTGLATRAVGGTGKDPGRGAIERDRHHGVAHHIDMFRFETQIHGGLQRQNTSGAGHRILGGDNQLGFAAYATVGQHRRGLRQLQHREGVVTLPDSERDGFAGVPLLLLRPLVVVALPFLARQHTARLAQNVDTGNLPESQRLHEIVHGVDAELVGQ